MIARMMLSLLSLLIAAGPCVAAEPDSFFPIMAWNHAPNDPAVLKRMRECGLTVAGFVTPETLDNCQDAGLKAIVANEATQGYDWRKVDAEDARRRVTELVKRVKDHPAVYGYSLRDEPSAEFFPGLATVAHLVKELHPGAWPYINLFPNYASPEQLGTPTYDAYLKQFIEVCKPPILSYDHYALTEGGGFNEAYFTNLEAMRREALAHEIPFWNIVLASGCLNFREVSATDFRFQVYTSLAYGARGISYFTYFAVPSGNFRMAPVDQFGHETATWNWMRHVNLQVVQLAPTLLKLKSDGVYHFGKIPAGCSGPEEKSLVKAIPGPMLVGDFTHEDGSRYVMVVNRDFVASTPCQPQFRESPTKLEVVSPYTGQLVPYVGEQMWLAPGQGSLLKVSK